MDTFFFTIGATQKTLIRVQGVDLADALTRSSAHLEMNFPGVFWNSWRNHRESDAEVLRIYGQIDLLAQLIAEHEPTVENIKLHIGECNAEEIAAARAAMVWVVAGLKMRHHNMYIRVPD